VNRNAFWYLVVIPLAGCACGFGVLIVPWLWPAMNVFGWMLPLGPTLIVLLIGFDRIRHRYQPPAFYKELFGRVVLAGTAIVVAWILALGYLWDEPLLPILALPFGVISMGIMGAVSFVYAIIRAPGQGPGPGFLPCPGCGYRIDNVPGPCCPECGQRLVAERDAWTPSDMGRGT
jgi:hypothetical protein